MREKVKAGKARKGKKEKCYCELSEKVWQTSSLLAMAWNQVPLGQCLFLRENEDIR